MAGALDVANFETSSDLNAENEEKIAYRAELNAMGIEPEAEDDEKEIKPAKSSTKKKEKAKTIKCEEYLSVIFALNVEKKFYKIFGEKRFLGGKFN